MNFIQLTNVADGSTIYLQTSQITFVATNQYNQLIDVHATGAVFNVKETLGQIAAKLTALGPLNVK